MSDLPNNVIPLHKKAPPGNNEKICFNRKELSLILSVYGQFVAAGLWRDYAIDYGQGFALFSVFRRSSELPLYRIEKRPKNRHKQGQYCVLALDGRVLKRGSELKTVLRVFDSKLPKLQLIE